MHLMRREGLYVRSIVLDGLFDYIEKLDGNPLSLASASGLNVSPRKEKNSFESWGSICEFFERASTELNEPSLGLKWALELPDDFRSSGPNILIAITVKDIREFLDTAIAYQRIHTNGIAYSYAQDRHNNEVIGDLSIHPLSPPCRQYTEHIVAVIAQMGLRHLPGFSLKKVRFQHRAPNDLLWHEKAIGCPIEFNADKTEIITDGKLLNVKIGGRLAIGRPLLQGYLKHQLNRKMRDKESVKLMVSGILPSLLGVQKSDLASLASFIEINPKKLQRLLKDENTSYSEILDSPRQSLAGRLLIDSDISIQRMSGMLDYKSTEAFIVAARRWFGMSPTKYRSSMRQNKVS